MPQVSSQVFTSLSKDWKTVVQRLFEGNYSKHEWPVVTYYEGLLMFTSLSKAWKTAVQRLFEGNYSKHEWPMVTYYGELPTVVADERTGRTNALN
jgi:hypothetical protein